MLVRQLFYFRVLVSVLAASSSLPSIAQTSSPDSIASIRTELPHTVTSVTFAAAQDTVQAIHNLFQTRRKGGRLFAIQAGAGLLGAVGYLAMPVSDSSPSLYSYTATDKRQISSVLVAGALPVFGIGISKLSRFSKDKEKALILQYQAGGTVPATIRRRLRPKYFHDWPSM